jgi:hypothetical protein
LGRRRLESGTDDEKSQYNKFLPPAAGAPRFAPFQPAAGFFCTMNAPFARGDIANDRLKNNSHSTPPTPQNGSVEIPQPKVAVTSPPSNCGVEERAAARKRLVEQAMRNVHSLRRDSEPERGAAHQFTTSEFSESFLTALLACVVQHPDQIDWPSLSPGCWQTVASLTVAFSAFSLLKDHGLPPTWAAIEQAALRRVRKDDNSAEAEERIMDYLAELKAVTTERELPFVKSQVSEIVRQWKTEQALVDFANAVGHKRNAPPLEETRVALLEALAATGQNSVELQDVNRLIADQEPDAAPVVINLVERGDVVNFGAGSKSNKTWLALALALCAAHGKRWLETFDCEPTKVVYVNFELKRGKLRKRIEDICLAIGISVPGSGQFQLLNLRGKDIKAEDLVTSLICKLRTQDIGLIIIDPLYLLHGGRAENAAEQMAQLMALFGRLARELNCAVWINHHFSKGDQSGRDSIDRFSGSGVFGRYADGLITMTRHEEDDCFTVDFTLRGQQPVESFVVRWRYPLFQPEPKLDPRKLKRPKRGGSEKKCEVAEIVDCLDGRMTDKEWFGIVHEETGIALSTFKRRRNEAAKAGLVRKTAAGKWLKTERSVNTANPLTQIAV